MRARTKHYHSSSNTHRSAWSLWLAVKSALTWNDLITLTEVQKDPRVTRLRKIPGWGFVQVEGGAMDECAVLYAKWKWQFLKVEARLTSELAIPTTGRKVYALTVWLKHRRTGQILIVSVCHLPAHVEQLLREGRRTDTVRCYESCVQGWRVYLLSKRAQRTSIMAVADWNLDVRQKWVRAWLSQHFMGFKSAWVQGDALPDDGTFDRRLIDDTRYNNMDVLDIELARDDASSDHRPYREILLLP